MKKVILAVIVIVLLVIVVGVTSNKSSTNLTVGVIGPFSGPAASAGESIQRSLGLVATSSGVNFVYEDDQCDIKKALSAYQNLKLKDVKVFYAACSGSVSALAPLAAQDGNVILTAYAGSSDIRKTGTEVIRFIPDALTIVDAINEYIAAHPEDTYAVLYQNQDYAKSVVDALSDKAKVVFKEAYLPEDKTYLTLITKIKGSGATKVIYVPVSDIAAKEVLKEMQTLKLNLPIIGDVNLCDYSFSPKDFGLHGVCWRAELTTAGFEDFKTTFKATYNADPAYPFYDAVTYDVGTLLTQLLPKTKSIEELKKTILAGVEGKITKYTFEPNGEVIGSKYLVQVEF